MVEYAAGDSALIAIRSRGHPYEFIAPMTVSAANDAGVQIASLRILSYRAHLFERPILAIGTTDFGYSVLPL